MNPRPVEAIARAPLEVGASDLISDVRAGLARRGQKTLPSKYLYDEVGSALFEAISRLEEYGLTRADERILGAHSDAIVAGVAGPLCVAELGSGSGRKTRHVLEALARRQPTRYFPIDISATALALCAADLGRLPGVRVEPIESEYLEGLARVARSRREGERLLVLFLGSTIGNFDRPEGEEFLRGVRAALAPGDALLLGTDLLKPVERLLEAYDDPAGVSAAFNRNVLVRINRELDADFDLTTFEHVARWDARERRIEMRLRSRVGQAVHIRLAGLEVRFRPGETIWTESSHKYSPEEPAQLARRTGYRCTAQWTDREWAFAESLLIAE